MIDSDVKGVILDTLYLLANGLVIIAFIIVLSSFLKF